MTGPGMQESPQIASQSIPLLRASDIVVAGGVFGMGAASWIVPMRYWRALSLTFAPLAMLVSDTGGGSVERIGTLMGDRIPDRSPRRIRLESYAYFIEGNLQLLRMYRPGGWNPVVRVLGEEHLRAALARGKGAVLWMSWLKAYSLVAKIALRRAGFEVSHLSHPRHGYGNTRFLIRWLNPICTRIEDRYLRERVTLSHASFLTAMRILKRRLHGNGIVSVTASARSESPVSAPFLAGKTEFAPGAPFLSYSTGAALLPVHPVQTGPGEFAVTIDHAIDVSRDLPRDAFAVQAACKYAASLEPWVVKYPGQWLAWQDQ